MNYYVTHEGTQYGPFPLEQLRQMLAEGRIVPQDLAWIEGSAEWVPLSQIAGIYAAPPQIHIPPPSLHWALLLLFSLITCGIFPIVWLFVQASFVKQIDRQSNALAYYAVGMVIICLAGGAKGTNSNFDSYSSLLSVGGAVVLMIGHYNLKASLEKYYNSIENIGLVLSSTMTLFFNTIYFQYHFNRITDWKKTGQLRP